MKTDIPAVKDYHCAYCKALMMRFGNFRSEFPEYKELKVYKVRDKDNLKFGEMYSKSTFRKIGIHVPHIVCSECNNSNNFYILFRDIDMSKMKIKV